MKKVTLTQYWYLIFRSYTNFANFATSLAQDSIQNHLVVMSLLGSFTLVFLHD